MDRYLIECTIDSTKLDLLAATRTEHYEFLIAHRNDIVFGGPARAQAGGPPQTMVIVVHADSLRDAEEFIAAEPYNRHGGFSSVTVRHWNQVMPEPVPGALQATLDAERAGRRSG